MKRLLVLLAAPLLLAAGCSSASSGTPAAGPTTAASAATSAPATAVTSAPATEPSGTAAPGTGGGVSSTEQASTSRCHTGDLKLSLGEGEGAAGTAYVPLIFKNVSDRTCTLYGFPGVSWVAGDDGHQVNVPFARTDAAKSTITLAAGAVAHATLATHDVGFYDAAQCQAVSVRGYRVYPPDETTSIFVPLATKACSAKGIDKGKVSPIAKGATA
jgi:hypothetical protein